MSTVDWGMGGEIRRPFAVRVTVYPGVELPQVELWGREPGADGEPDRYPYRSFFRPVCATDGEWAELLGDAEFFTFKEVEPPTLNDLREQAENMRGRILLDRSRGVNVFESQLWAEFGWDVGSHGERLGIKHGSQAAARIFHIVGQQPTGEELDWFRTGFSYHRQGKPRPTLKG